MSDVKNWLRARFCENGDEQMSSTKREKYLHQIVKKVCPVALLTYPWSRVLLEKLTGSAASQEIPRIFGTRRFLTVPTSARHLSLS